MSRSFRSVGSSLPTPQPVVVTGSLQVSGNPYKQSTKVHTGPKSRSTLGPALKSGTTGKVTARGKKKVN